MIHPKHAHFCPVFSLVTSDFQVITVNCRKKKIFIKDMFLITFKCTNRNILKFDKINFLYGNTVHKYQQICVVFVGLYFVYISHNAASTINIFFISINFT